MEPALFARALAAALFTLSLVGAAQPEAASAPTTRAGPPHPWAQACERWDEWEKPGPAFRVHGNTWYVGTCGIAAILVTSDDGHVLIDTGTEAGADLVLANIRSLGFDPADVELLLTSHEHFDHVGGMAKMQAATGAKVVSSQIGIYVLANGADHPADPQAGMHEPMQRITHGMPYDYADAPELLARFGMTAHPTPGHTPGAMSWSWQSCDAAGDCRNMVYADSMSPVSSDDYRFSDHPEYIVDYLQSLDRIAALDCGMLLTPHPSASDLHGLLQRQMLGIEEPDFACAGYANAVRTRLSLRLAQERGE